jgi:S1-C subfamily serine protease
VLELRAALLGSKPGETVELLVSRDGEESTREVTLGGRPRFQQFPERRLQVMERMGGELSRLRDGFPAVIESDIKLEPNLCGGPVVDMDGQVIGLSAARASRTRSYVIPSARIVELLKEEPTAPGLAQAQAQAPRPQAMPRMRGGRAPLDPGAADRMRQRLNEMRRLMEMFEREMRDLEGR